MGCLSMPSRTWRTRVIWHTYWRDNIICLLSCWLLFFYYYLTVLHYGLGLYDWCFKVRGLCHHGDHNKYMIKVGGRLWLCLRTDCWQGKGTMVSHVKVWSFHPPWPSFLYHSIITSPCHPLCSHHNNYDWHKHLSEYACWERLVDASCVGQKIK